MKKEHEQKERARWKGFIETLQNDSEWMPNFPREEIWTNHNSRLWYYAPVSKKWAYSCIFTIFTY